MPLLSCQAIAFKEFPSQDSYLNGLLAGHPLLAPLVPEDEEGPAIFVEGQAAHRLSRHGDLGGDLRDLEGFSKHLSTGQRHTLKEFAVFLFLLGRVDKKEKFRKTCCCAGDKECPV